MFHLKFQRGDYATNISCPHYDVDRRDARAFVIAYKGFTNEGGVEYLVDHYNPRLGYEGPTPFDVCFVTNDAGKTVDRIGPFLEAQHDPTMTASELAAVRHQTGKCSTNSP